MHRNKWLEYVYYKCKSFLDQMGKDCKTDNILSKPFQSIRTNVSQIYRKDGKSLLQWVTGEYRLDSQVGGMNDKKEANITSYKEQFKNMLSLDIWVGKLAQWQSSGYKLEIPQKEPVDSLKWNLILKDKLKDAMTRGNHTQRKPQNSTMPTPAESSNQDNLFQKQERKRKYCNYGQPNDQIEDPEKLRTLKQKKLNESHCDGPTDSMISTEKASVNSALVPVKMEDLFKKIKAIKKEVIEKIEDDSSKNIVKLSELDSSRICVTQCLSFIDEYNLRASKIIENCFRNVQMKNRNNPKFFQIKQEIYSSQIPLKRD